MGGLDQFFRLLFINRVLLRHGLDEIILATHLLRPLRFLSYLSPWRWFSSDVHQPRAVRIRRVLEDLGPIFVKFGQILSTRRDLLPDDIAEELTKLQDQVPPFDVQDARSIVERECNNKIDDLFLQFDDKPLASASIAQVHSAKLLNGQDVVVKIVRPNIEATIKHDIAILYTIAELAQRYWSDGRRLRPVEVVAEYEKTILDELDLMREAGSASQLRRNFKTSDMLYVPKIHWPLCRHKVMVMERISGTPISNIEELRDNGVDLKQLAEHGVEIFFTQVFRDSFFHADMHPGNIFVSPEGQYIAIDFGIMGTLNDEDQHYLAENFLAFFRRDYRRVAELHLESGWIPKHTRIDELESAIRTVCEPIFERPLRDISFGQLLLRLFQTARRFDMEVQPQLVLLQKTLLNIEGLGRQLYPDLDLWQTAKPYLENWMKGRIGVRSVLKEISYNIPKWADMLPEIPTLLHEVLVRAQQGELTNNRQLTQQLENLRKDIRRTNRLSFRAIVGSAFIVSAVVLQGLDGYGTVMFANAPLLTWMLGGLGAIVLIFSWPNRD